MFPTVCVDDAFLPELETEKLIFNLFVGCESRFSEFKHIDFAFKILKIHQILDEEYMWNWWDILNLKCP